jgi:hypothetical protein
VEFSYKIFIAITVFERGLRKTDEKLAHRTSIVYDSGAIRAIFGRACKYKESRPSEPLAPYNYQVRMTKGEVRGRRDMRRDILLQHLNPVTRTW